MREHLTQGVICAALTPVDDGGAACIELLVTHCRSLLDAGCHGIVLLGTTGEANSFTLAERQAILEGVLAGGISPAKLIVGTGCCAAGDTASLTRHALSLGVNRALMLPPFYYKSLSDQGVIDAFGRAIDAIADPRLRVYLYQIPQLTGVSIGAAIIEALRIGYPSIVSGIKDSSGDLTTILQLCARFGDEFDVLAGSERYLAPALNAGASGCVSATANVNAAMIRRLYDQRKTSAASSLQEQVSAVRNVFEAYPMIAALKQVLGRRTGELRWRNLRPPLSPLAGGQAEALFAAYAAETVPA